ncbi:oxidoreductase family protein [uncultured Algibacter sp.]|uniref:oxidoreductase family protein n=1 Tax=uncultured Algibacter sp. TaxID=298659 RepID=UPI002609DF7F|nr:oxidoreductase family protein [uncultured Algibacter sp.]
MNPHIQNIILEATKAKEISETEIIQNLWSDYGKIIRCSLKGSRHNSIIVKHIQLPDKNNHPRGWNTNVSHQRKLKSYQIEIEFYKSWSKYCKTSCYLPTPFYLENIDTESLIVLEDLNDSGFSERKTFVNLFEVKLCLTWLANFHACFMDKAPKDLWEIGTYWHLKTRPDELKALLDLPLRDAASAINKTLNDCKFQTFVHGDAKLANFCFSSDSKKVAAVDFQYVGGGCGMKDIAYFLGSCLSEEECEQLEPELLNFYFKELTLALKDKNTNIQPQDVEREWRQLYPIAQTDFHRFIKGWSPGHWKINSYSERVAQDVISKLKNK